MTAEKASTAMAACVSRVLLDTSRGTTTAAAICVWRSARASTATKELRVLHVETALNRMTIGQPALRVQPGLLVSTGYARRAWLLSSLVLMR